MFSPSVFKAKQQESAQKASQENKEPYVLWNEDEIDEFPPFPFPDLGDYFPEDCPEDWEYVRDDDGEKKLFLVDSSGFGSRTEPALTVEQFKSELQEVVEEYKDDVIGFGIYEQGQFQLHVAVYRKVEGDE